MTLPPVINLDIAYPPSGGADMENIDKQIESSYRKKLTDFMSIVYFKIVAVTHIMLADNGEGVAIKRICFNHKKCGQTEPLSIICRHYLARKWNLHNRLVSCEDFLSNSHYRTGTQTKFKVNRFKDRIKPPRSEHLVFKSKSNLGKPSACKKNLNCAETSAFFKKNKLQY